MQEPLIASDDPSKGEPMSDENDESIVIPEQTMSTQGHSLRCRWWDARPCNCGKQNNEEKSIVIPEQTMSTQGHSLRCRWWDARPCNCGKRDNNDAD